MFLNCDSRQSGKDMSKINYFLKSKNSRLTNGHIASENLYGEVMGHDGKTAYCCYFDLDYDSLKIEYDTGKLDKDKKRIYEYKSENDSPSDPSYKCNGKTFTQYEGICWPAFNLVSFDFDAEDITDSLEDVRKFIQYLDLEKNQYTLFFSGSKGFHLLIPFSLFDLSPSADLVLQLKDLAKYLKNHYPTLDDSIYNYNRKFRVPFTKHEKTGLFKNVIDPEWEIEQIKTSCLERCCYNFLVEMDLESDINTTISGLIDLSKRQSYEIEKHRAGNLEKPSPFEKFDDKKCIEKMLQNRCEDVGRNNAALRIVNDYFRTGKPLVVCESDLATWANNNDLPISEITSIINNIYQRGSNYNFGCQDEIKASYCTAKCVIWKKLDADKRPPVVDSPLDSENSAKSEIGLAKKLLEEIFYCEWNERAGEFSGGYVCRQGKDDIFFYKNGYWQYVDEAGVAKIKRLINTLGGGKLTVRRIDNAFKMFVTYVPGAVRDMFIPVNNAAAFRNGTLYLREETNGNYFLEFIEGHNPKDGLTTKFNFDYIENGESDNELFNQMLDRIFEDDSEEDKVDKINALSEMYGACLIPYFPHLFFMCGKAKSGKSTLILILNELLDKEEHICSVQPKDWKGFFMEPMIGKLVNLVTDVSTKKNIEDDMVKQIEDRVPVSINRKGKSVLRVPLPAVHIFAGNDFMTSSENANEAMKRRWTIIRFKKTYLGSTMRNFAYVCYNSNPQGIINFAIKGLKRLIDNQGFFTEFKSSSTEINNWSLESDIIGEFFKAIEEDEESNLVFLESGKIKRRELYQYFVEWKDACGHKKTDYTASWFYKNMKNRGFKESWIGSTRSITGISVKNDSKSNSRTHSDEI